MRLRLLDRIRRSRRRHDADKVRPREHGGEASAPGAAAGSVGAHRRAGGGRFALPRIGSGRSAPPRSDGQPPRAGNAQWASPRAGGGRPASPYAGGGQPASPYAGGGQPASPYAGGGQPASPYAGGGQPPSPYTGGGQPLAPDAGGGRLGNGTRGPARQAPVAGSPRQPAGHAGQVASHALPRRWGIARAAARVAPKTAAADPGVRTPGRPSPQAAQAKPPWYEIAQHNRTAVGRRHCGRIERLVHREWAEEVVPPPEIVRAIDRLAELPQIIKARLATGLDAIYVGIGGVPSLDDMSRLSGVPLPSGRATWDACAGAYGERKIIVGSRPSPSPDVMCHEIGHALDDIDGGGEQWQSDSAEFHSIYDQCLPHMVSAFHRQPGMLGRREFFADAFAAIASRQRPALVEMLGGDTRSALNVMLYFNVRYGI